MGGDSKESAGEILSVDQIKQGWGGGKGGGESLLIELLILVNCIKNSHVYG